MFLMIAQRGDSGSVVGEIQQLLSEDGYSVPQAELTASLYGDGTRNAVLSFQASHVGPTGRGLARDGVVGPETLYALQHPGHDDHDFTVPGWRSDLSQVREQVRRVLGAAVGEIGVFEDPDGSNDGPRIRKYTSPGFVGSPWCALFASWAFSIGCDGGSPFGRIASTWELYGWAVRTGRVLGASTVPQAGDIFVILHGTATDAGRHGHTGIICNILDDGHLATIAGNESNAVRGGIRSREAVSAILRPVPLV